MRSLCECASDCFGPRNFFWELCFLTKYFGPKQSPPILHSNVKKDGVVNYCLNGVDQYVQEKGWGGGGRVRREITQTERNVTHVIILLGYCKSEVFIFFIILHGLLTDKNINQSVHHAQLMQLAYSTNMMKLLQITVHFLQYTKGP